VEKGRSCFRYMLPKKRGTGEAELGSNSAKKRRNRLEVGIGSVVVVVVEKDREFVMAPNNNNSFDVEIDEDLHSRQLAVYGRETMRRVFGAHVLISGLRGLGAEIAKNVILAGVKSVTLHDAGQVEMWDLSAQFYFTEEDIGKNRALACVEKLKELNKAVTVVTNTDEIISEDLLASHQVVVLTDVLLEKAIEIDEFCRRHEPVIAFIKAEICGVFGSVFCDFGPSFTVFDVDGEEPHTAIVASISNDNPSLVATVDDDRLEFQDGDLVIFSEVRGMVQLNDGKPRRVRDPRPFSFFLEEDTSGFGAYEKGGIITQVKPPKLLHFRSLKEALSNNNPGEFLLSDFAKFDRPQLLHLAFQALDTFRAEWGQFPAPGSKADASKIVGLVHRLNKNLPPDQRLETIDENVLKLLASGSRAVLNPMAAMFGGIVGQEVLKACSGKFHPLFQFFYFDSVESLPVEPLLADDLKPRNSRYDAQIAVFGHKLQQKLEDSKVFLVGAGAIGCEILKNLALMGVSSGQKGKLFITDDDVIEKSNLSRQFLFRDWNIHEAKSTVASAAARAINPAVKVEALQNRVSPDTEDVFDDAFWENLDVVINALDNVNARLYVDSRCVYFQKPLLESGTLGTKCNTQMVIPNMTENYGASRDPPEKQAPMCTLHSFPHNIDHCLTWARSEFEGLLEKTPAEANAFLLKPEEYKTAVRTAGDSQALELLEHVVECLVTDRCVSFEDCIKWARTRFEDYFSNRVKQLTFTFPENAITNTGSPFWSAPKRFPKPLEFTSTDPGQLSFVAAGAILCAETYGIPIPDWAWDAKKLSEAVDSIKLAKFVPKEGVRIETDEKATNMNSISIDDESQIEQLIGTLEEGVKDLPTAFHMNPIQFEKDDDTNYHMDFIAGLANMRARTYSIPEVDKLKAKFIAGRIIPAIATTTAMTTGLICLELYKVLLGHSVEQYRNTFVNLALPLFSMAEPVPPKLLQHLNLKWSIWDRWVIPGDLTLRELIAWFDERGLTAYSVSCGQSLLYNNIFAKHQERIDRKISDLARDIAKLNIPPNRHHFDIVVACEDEDGNDLDVPLVSIYFR